MKRTILVLSVLAIAVASTAAAGEGYVGLGIGWTKIEISQSGVSFSPDDTGFEVFGGYKFFRYLAIEGSYADLGDLKSNSALGSLDAESDVWNLYALGILPATPRLDLYGKLGAALWNLDGTVNLGTPMQLDESGTDLAYGVGLAYRFTNHWGLRLEWEQFRLDSDEASFASLAVIYEF